MRETYVGGADVIYGGLLRQRKFWRMTDLRNPDRVSGGTVHGNLMAVSSFYEWAGRRYEVANPVSVRELRQDSRGRPGWG